MSHNDGGNTNTEMEMNFLFLFFSVSGRFARKSLTLTAELDDNSLIQGGL